MSLDDPNQTLIGKIAAVVLGPKNVGGFMGFWGMGIDDPKP